MDSAVCQKVYKQMRLGLTRNSLRFRVTADEARRVTHQEDVARDSVDATRALLGERGNQRAYTAAAACVAATRKFLSYEKQCCLLNLL
jgi:hypothetical protein